MLPFILMIEIYDYLQNYSEKLLLIESLRQVQNKPVVK